MDDLISRQEAIDEVVAWMKDCMSDKKNGKPLTERLKDLPSVQSEITHCRDCAHLFEDNKCPLRTWWTHTEDDFCSKGERRADESD